MAFNVKDQFTYFLGLDMMDVFKSLRSEFMDALNKTKPRKMTPAV